MLRRSLSVRPEGPDVRALVARGVERSATFRGLLDELDRGDVLVYVRFAPCNGRVRACLVWASTNPAMRRVMIKIDRHSGSEDDLTALLAHELRHATEVTSAPEIKDGRSFQQWFDGHGRRGWHGYETDAAVAVTTTVTSELCSYVVGRQARR